MDIFKITEPTVARVPIIISSPHSGTFFPKDITDRLKPKMAKTPDDADWFIDQLYDFAPQLGITIIAANYCRWVIDLNRDPESKPLYADGRVITGLVPLTNFNGNPLYDGKEPNETEIQSRIERYYNPYHREIERLLQQTKSEFGHALLFDAHSIRKIVPGIQSAPFPDLILGDNDETSAGKNIIDITYGALQKENYHVEHNHPFKGGYITRSFGKPSENIHALQLEMAKTNYMDDSETRYDEVRANKMRDLLHNMFLGIIAEMNNDKK